VVLWDTDIESELIEQARLIAALPLHHDQPPTSTPRKAESLFGDNLKPFSTASVKLGNSRSEHIFSGPAPKADIRRHGHRSASTLSSALIVWGAARDATITFVR
jgi:hypothetical protein